MMWNMVIPLLVVTLIFTLHKLFFGSLSRFPGPLGARLTDIWRLVDVWNGTHQYTLRRLHTRYDSSIVRIGPNLLSLSNPQWIKIIYSTKGDFKKTKSYSVNDIKLPDGNVVPTTFSVRDEQLHAEMMKPIQRLYNLNNILSYEAQIDEVIDIFIKALDGFTDGRKVDLGDQLNYVAYDAMANMTLGTLDGYLHEQDDFEGVLKTSDRVWDYFSRVSQMPWVDTWLAKSDILTVSQRFPSFAQTMHMRCVKQIDARLKEGMDVEHKDFLEDFIEIGGGRDNPNVPMLVAWLSSNIVAGSDTVAIQLKAAMYYILKHPDVHEKLRREFESANLACPITHHDAKKFQYLDAVIKESMRLHPAVGMLLERVVPEPGIQLPNGPFLPGGTCVGMNAWVVHLNEVFGPDPEVFVPERWLIFPDESKEAYSARLKRMHDADMTFGSGRRICSGKFVAQVEMYKVLAALLSVFEIELVDPTKEWEVMNSWFTRQKGIEVYVRRRRSV